jgi:hypothetical protein
MLDNQRRRCLPQRWLFVRSGERGAWVHPQIAVLETAGAQGSGRTRDGRVTDAWEEEVEMRLEPIYR